MKGYFDIISAVDEFILYDDMQYTPRDWRNRNQIKTPKGAEWLTVPVGHDRNRRIRDVIIVNEHWKKKHWLSFESNYRRAPYYEEIASLLRPVYLEQNHSYLSALNRTLIELVCDYLGISTKISNSWDYHLIDGKTEKLVDLCAQAGATEYISGPSAKNYIDEQMFNDSGIRLTWFDYSSYPEYMQLWGDFLHSVSVLDLLFNCGTGSRNLMKCVNK